jgi:hypothetical protein
MPGVTTKIYSINGLISVKDGIKVTDDELFLGFLPSKFKKFLEGKFLELQTNIDELKKENRIL